MLNKIVNYYKTHRRDFKQNMRTNYTRPMKNILHSYKIYLIRKFLETKFNFLQIKNLRFIGLFIVLFWLFRDFAFAADTNTGDTATNGINSVVDFLNGFIFLIALIAQPVVMFVGWLLSPDWTFGDIIGLRPVIHNIWILVSNIVYFIFALMLIVIALMNIFSESKSFALKSSLPRLVVGILIVPFTWFAVSATLSVANVLTASVLSFSKETIIKETSNSSISNTDSVKNLLEKRVIPKKIKVDLSETSGTGFTAVNCDTTPDDCISLKDLLGNTNGPYNLLSYYAYGIFKIDKLKEIGKDQAGNSIKKIGDIFKKLTFTIIFSLVFAILVIAIAFALFTRMAMMWLFAMFSPLFALSYFLGGKGPKGLENIEKKLSFKAFISLAMVPVYVSAALSFGLIFLSLAMNGSNYAKSEYISMKKGGEVENNVQSMTFLRGESAVELQIKGNYVEKTSGIAGDMFDAGEGIISNIIISLLALIILWMAVMAALGADEITKSAVKPIADFGDSIGKLMVDAPKYIPLKIPGTSGKDGKPLTMTIEGMSSLGQNIKGHYEQMARQTGSDFATHFTGKSDLVEPINKLTTAMNSSKTAVTKQQLSGLKSILDAAKGDTTLIANDPNARTALKSFIDILKTKDEKLAGELGKLTLTNPDDVARYFAGMDHFTDNHEAEYGINMLDTANHKGGGWRNENRESIKKQSNGGSSVPDEPNTNPKPTLSPKDSIVKGNKNVTFNIIGKDKKDNNIIVNSNENHDITKVDFIAALNKAQITDKNEIDDLIAEIGKQGIKIV